MPAPVVVIGTGAGGGAAAWMLTQKGIPVIALEAGPSFNPSSEYSLHRPDWELKGFPYKEGSQSRFSFAPLQTLVPRWDHLRSWNAVGGRINTGNTRLSNGTGHQHVRGVGGSTLHFTGEAHRMMPFSLKPTSGSGVPVWPLDYDSLEPWYSLAETIIGVAGDAPADNDPRWRSEQTLQPAHPFCAASKWVKQHSGKQFHWVANTRAALSRALSGRPACNYCANCQLGCPRGDKGSVDVTFIKQAQSTGLLELRTECQATELVMSEDRKITHVLYRDKQGTEHRQACDQVIVAAGSMETPRLLLNSPGVAALNDQIGKHLMMHLNWVSSGLVSADILTHRGLPADMICWDPCKASSEGYRLGVSTTEIRLSGPVNYAQRAIAGWGAEHKQAMRQQFGKALSISAIGAAMPNARTFVDLDPEKKDAFGKPLARIHHHLPDTELERLGQMQASCRQVLQLCGASGMIEEYGSYDFLNSTHTLGTCRMGLSPKDSVTSPEGQFHGIDNLYISDASLFTNSGNGEAPSLTIEALALRNAERLANRQLSSHS
ncbi:GMC oxidoreductase [Marinobacterium sediminicola]|uniref:Choline dehydrogenase n=1 Tax=Marinobacterium sediminicola TaxID=518898 RepID=A0ABY1S0Y7_9GAMM|nr:GMC family oxidoreductase [Marinobacterium sediminicola]ULG68368.1 GMC family oxidoreductase [Marinobacterium sediminicola]SMR74753.1 Choline dehydrogenase [Marinobacterium sediminicola]